MSPLLKRFGRLRMVAVMLVTAPFLVLPLLGLAWLFQNDVMVPWLLSMIAFGALAYLLHTFAQWRENRLAKEPVTTANPAWPPSAEGAWASVDGLAASIDPEAYPLTEGQKLWDLGHITLQRVATYYHPQREDPLLEMTLPHALMIIERASRELRHEISAHVPLSHQVTLGHIARAKKFRDWLSRLETFYRVGRVAIDPASVVFAEVRREVANRIFDYGSDRVQRWLIREFVRKVGYYAIELYSGQVLLDDVPATRETARSRRDAREAADIERISEEPVRIVVMGCSNAGKSSLINALLDEPLAAIDELPGTTPVAAPYHLRREGQDAALVFDTPGIADPAFLETGMKTLALSADLILWVTHAHAADREEERLAVERVQACWRDLHDRPAPPWLLVVTHIDTLRPAREWRPPYDIADPSGSKATAIRDATLAAAEALGLPLSHTVPVCLAEGRRYNVDDALWAAIFSLQKETGRARFLRCLDDRKRQENWTLIGRQLLGAGRLLIEAPFKRRP